VKTFTKNSIFTNVALTPEGDIWWESFTKTPPSKLTDWLGNPWESSSDKKAAHPNARFTAPINQCPVADPNYDNPRGVPISAILFGGRRPSVLPLVFEAFNWTHGTFLGSIQSSETTAAQTGAVGVVRRDPMAMLPFCGYNMGDYLGHWLKTGRKTRPENLPKIFYVNWFRKSEEGKWLWPGYGENIRVLKWIYERATGTGAAIKTPIGNLPTPDSLDIKGLDISKDDLRELLRVDREGWKNELPDIDKHFARLGERLPEELRAELDSLSRRLNSNS